MVCFFFLLCLSLHHHRHHRHHYHHRHRTSITAVSQTVLHWCCGPKLKVVKVVPVLNHILLDWQIWNKAPTCVWEQLLCQLELLLITPSKGVVSHTSINWSAFMEAKAIAKLLMATKVCMHLHIL